MCSLLTNAISCNGMNIFSNKLSKRQCVYNLVAIILCSEACLTCRLNANMNYELAKTGCLKY